MKQVISFITLYLLVNSTSSAQAVVEWLFSDFLNNPPENAEIIGNPAITGSPYGDAVLFNGVDDGIFLDYTPLVHLSEFTIEVIMRPDKDGLTEQRFIHMGEMSGERVMLETRLTPEGYWYVDAFVQNGELSLTMIDSTKLHPLGEWYNVALVNRKGTLEVFINGVTEFRENISFTPFKGGRTSLGVRQNKVYWYKGAIYKIRISPKSLSLDEFLSY